MVGSWDPLCVFIQINKSLAVLSDHIHHLHNLPSVAEVVICTLALEYSTLNPPPWVLLSFVALLVFVERANGGDFACFLPLIIWCGRTMREGWWNHESNPQDEKPCFVPAFPKYHHHPPTFSFYNLVFGSSFGYKLEALQRKRLRSE